MLQLKRGDTVQIIAGAEKGKRGSVTNLDGERVTVQGINLCYKHIKRSQKYPQGGRVQMERSIHVSNVMLVDPNIDKPSRFKVGEVDGKKVRISVKSGKPI